MPAITVNRLRKSYDDTHVLNNLTFNVETGAIFGLLGPNGAGKTTTIDILTGVTQPDSGTLSIDGIDPTTNPISVREQVGILPEKEAPPSFLTPREYFQFIADVRNLDHTTLEDKITDWAERLDFTQKLNVLCKNLSRGQQQKVMLAQALIHEPSLVFIDEPLANLDPVMQERVKEFIKNYNEKGNTIVLCTHHVEVAQELCTDIGILNAGSFTTQFDPRDLADNQSVRDLYLEEMTPETQTHDQ